MHPSQLRIEDYTYELPDSRIAKYPEEDRDASKLLIYKNGQIEEDIYRNIAEYIPTGTLMVFNETKVVQARLLFKKDTGGIIEVFCLEPHEQYADITTAMQQRSKVWWKCLIGGASKWKHGMILSMDVEQLSTIVNAQIVEREAGSFTVLLEWDTEHAFSEILEAAGDIPLPPYLNREAEAKDKDRYQTTYAKEEGSVAAPTAGLHFTPTVFSKLSDKNIDRAFITLHVGAGTFKPVKSETMQEHEMHAEWIDVHIDTIQQIIQKLNDGIVVVGTTSLRTIESLYWIGAKLLMHITPDVSGIAVQQWEPYDLGSNHTAAHALQALADWMMQQKLEKLVTRTRIIIAPGYKFRIAKGLVTNFHQPQSTLLLLIAAVVGQEWKDVYKHALEHNYRFLSYGDGSLLWMDDQR
jgi:S-adenosylmethionine:tRNA ribosyltransferase-isomerase